MSQIVSEYAYFTGMIALGVMLVAMTVASVAGGNAFSTMIYTIMSTLYLATAIIVVLAKFDLI